MTESNNVVATLTEARRLIAEVGWCQGTAAIDRVGNRVGSRDPSACAFCTIGAISKACGTVEDRSPATVALRSALSVAGIASWNDDVSRTKQDVIDAFDRAIELAKTGGQQ